MLDVGRMITLLVALGTAAVLFVAGMAIGSRLNAEDDIDVRNFCGADSIRVFVSDTGDVATQIDPACAEDGDPGERLSRDW